MRRQRWMMLALISFVMISLTVLSSASWFIIFRKNQVVQYTSVVPDTSPYFTTGGTYNGEEQLPELTDAGKALYGADFTFKVEWQSGLRADGTTPIDAKDDESYLGKAAGKHYYKIIDTKTGQVICQNHEVSVGKATLTGTPQTLNTVVLPGGTVSTYDFSWTGVNGETFKTTELVNVTAPSNFSSNQLTYSVDHAVAFDSADVTAKPDLAWHYNNYNGATSKVTYKVVATCYSYTDGTATYYGSLDTALDTTKDYTSATTVVAMQSFTANGTTFTANPNATTGIKFVHTITGDHIVGANVTLVVPYKATTAFNAKDEVALRTDRFATGASTTDDDGKVAAIRLPAAPKCVNEIILSNGELNNKGKIQVCGITGYPYPDSKFAQSSTTGDHATITLKNATILMNSGSPEIELHGYIADGGNGKINVATGVITAPFVIYDYGGGTETVALFAGTKTILSLLGANNIEDANVSPFTTFDMPNIQAELTCRGGAGGAKLVGMVSLYTSSISMMGIEIPAQYNLADFTVFADQEALFNMSEGTAVFQYNPEKIASYAYNTSNYNPNRKATTKIVLNGTTVSGDISMKLTLGFANPTVSLAQVKLPVSDKIKLHLTGDHTYTFSTAYKFLPGSELYIRDEANVLVESGGGLMFYESLDVSTNGAVLYNEYYNKDVANTPALCKIENGSLTVKGSLGGTVTANGGGCLLDLSQATSLQMQENEGTGSIEIGEGLLDKLSSKFVFTTKQTIQLSANGIIVDSNSLFGNKGYYSTAGSSSTGYVWKEALSSADISGSITLNGGVGDVIGGNGTFTNGNTSIAAEGFYYPETGILLSPLSLFTRPTLANQEFVGWWLDTDNDGVIDQEAVEEQISSSNNVQLYAKWKYSPQVTVGIYDYGNSSIGSKIVYLNGYLTVPATTPKNDDSTERWYLTNWTLSITSNGEKIIPDQIFEPGAVVCLREILGLEEGWEQNQTSLVDIVQSYTISLTPNGSTEMLSIYISSVGDGTLTGSFASGNLVAGETYWVRPGQIVSIIYNPEANDKSFNIMAEGVDIPLHEASGDDGEYFYAGSVEKNWTVTANSKSCIAAGTMITLADGTQKAVEDLVEGDMLLVFDHETGKYIECPILFIERDGWREYTVINLTFSNGTTTRLIYEHGLFDLTLNRYVYITEQNYSEFVGHEFAVLSEDGYETVTMTDAFLTTEYTGCYSLVTVYHFNYFIDGLFSMPGGIEGLFNFFEYDENLCFDAEQMAADIEKYGLYTYEDFAPYMPEEIFELFQAPYYKVAVEKGMITFEEIVELIERYLVQHGIV